jgi:uncharacterized membrane protein YgcG
MKGKTCMGICAWVLALSLTVPAGVFAQDVGAPPAFRQEELDQMLAPIALYPDALLAQVLMAATYPLEVVMAARWAQANPGLSGERLAKALEQKDWDPSIKSLINFPSLLTMMGDKLDWTRRLGDAFLTQEGQVMDTVQQLRSRALAAGNLETTGEQNIVVQEKTIVIEPATPEVIYVPVYNPTVVYGTWWYPAYPPYWFYPPGYFIGPGLIAFGTGVFLGAAWGYAWGGCNWYRRGVYVNVYQNRNYNHYFNRHRYSHGGTPPHDGQDHWRHDPGHRKSVAYRDRNTQRHYGQTARSPGQAGRDLRAHSPERGIRRTSTGGRPGAELRPPAKGRSQVSPDRRVSATSGAISLNQRRTASVYDRPSFQQRRGVARTVTQPGGPVSATYPAGMYGPAYRAGTASPPYRGGMANPSYHGGGGFSGRDGGGFSGRSGGFSGKGGGHRS